MIAIQVNNGAPKFISHTGGIDDTTSRLGLGRPGSQPGDHFDGRIDEVGIWKKVLSDTERTDLYNGGTGNTYTP